MDQIFETIKIIFTNMRAIGWEPWPIVFASVVSIMVRGYFEPDVLEINTIESKRLQGRTKLFSFLAAYFISVLASYGFDYPKDAHERIQVLCFSVLDAGLGYLAYTFWTIIDPITRFKDKYGKKGASNETPPVAPNP